MAKETKKRVTTKAPVKKAGAKKAVAKKPATKKAAAKNPVVKKAAVKKAAKPAKKAAVKKAAKPAKKAAAKKPAVKKAAVKKTVAKKPIAKKAIVPNAITAAPVNTWVSKEPALPVFLQNQSLEIKKDLVVTQKYNQKTNNSVKYMLAGFLVLLLGWGVNAYVLNSGSSSDAVGKNNSSSRSDSMDSINATESSDSSSNAQGQNGTSATPTPKPTSSDGSNGSSGKSGSASANSSPATSNLTATKQAPRTFTSVNSDQGATLKWLAPKSIGNVVAYELYGRVVGQADWVLLSTVTTDQLAVDVDLTPGLSKSEFRVASLLENDKQVFNKTIITLPGSIA